MRRRKPAHAGVGTWSTADSHIASNHIHTIGEVVLVVGIVNSVDARAAHALHFFILELVCFRHEIPVN